MEQLQMRQAGWLAAKPINWHTNLLTDKWIDTWMNMCMGPINNNTVVFYLLLIELVLEISSFFAAKIQTQIILKFNCS